MKQIYSLLSTLIMINVPYNYVCAEREFQFSVYKITSELLQRMPYTWRFDAPVLLDNLRFVTMTYYNFEGEVCDGELVIHKELIEDLGYIFKKLFEVSFPIQSMRLVDEFDGSDMKSMQANNTSAFYARKVAGADRWSNHSFGCALDINPLLNPYSSPRVAVIPAEAEEYLDRLLNFPGMIVKDNYIYKLFKERGWEWGGECFVERDGVVDRHHFQKVIPDVNQNTN